MMINIIISATTFIDIGLVVEKKNNYSVEQTVQ